MLRSQLLVLVTGAVLLTIFSLGAGQRLRRCHVWCQRYQRCYAYNRRCQRAYVYCQCGLQAPLPLTQRPTQPPVSSAPVASRPPGGTESERRCGQFRAGRGAGLLRIVGGQDASDCQLPATVVVRRGHGLCGGALVDDQHVLTAAHCVTEKGGSVASPSVLRVGYGSSRFKSLKFVKVTEVLRHPKYSTTTKDHDMAVLRLTRRLALGPCLQPLCVPSPDKTFPPGKACLVAGWGLLKEGGSAVPDHLQVATVPIVSPATCRRAYSRFYGDDKICAGYDAGGIDACQGDSGGPLMCVDGTTWYVAGIVSMGKGCARRNFPGVYTYVPPHASWIDDVTQP